jgi:hypothetical protein
MKRFQMYSNGKLWRELTGLDVDLTLARLVAITEDVLECTGHKIARMDAILREPDSLQACFTLHRYYCGAFHSEVLVFCKLDRYSE